MLNFVIETFMSSPAEDEAGLDIGACPIAPSK